LDPPPPNRLSLKAHDPDWFVLGYAAEGFPQFYGHRVTGEVALLPRAPPGEKWTHVGFSEQYGQAFVSSSYVLSEEALAKEALAKPASSAWLNEHLTLAVGQDSETMDEWIMTTTTTKERSACIIYMLCDRCKAKQMWSRILYICMHQCGPVQINQMIDLEGVKKKMQQLW